MTGTLPQDSRWVRIAAFLFGAAAACLVRGWHDSRRTRMGTQKCRQCGGSFRDLGEAGLGDPYVDNTTFYNRDENSTVRKQGYDPEPDGERLRRRRG